MPPETAAALPPEFPTLTLACEAARATLTLNRPSRGNALDARAGQDLRDALGWIQRQPGIRLLTIAANGPAFCVGGDLAAFAGETDLPAALDHMIGDFHAACMILATLDIPVLAIVHGPVAGAGVVLTSLADYAICARSATFSYAYPSIGFSADGGATWLLPRVMGWGAFRRFAVSNRPLAADEAVSSGLVAEAVADGELAEVAARRAAEMSAAPARALGAIRRLALDSFHRCYADQLEAEKAAIVGLAGEADTAQALGAMLARLSSPRASAKAAS